MSETIKTILTADSSNLRAEFTRAQATISQFHSRITSIGGALAGSAVIAGVVSGFNSIRNSIDALNDQAARLEMPVEEMQRLNAVATMSGSSVETLAKALNKSKLNAVEAAGGNESLAKAFAVLGIDAKRFLDLSATDRILALSEGFNTAKDQGAAFSAIFKVLGKSAGDLIPLLRDGAAGVEEISRKLKVLGGDDVAAVAKLNDEIDLLTANISTDLSQAFIALRPQIEAVVKTISAAAEGLRIFLDPAKGVGSQGGVLGGAAMLREMDELQAKIERITANPAKWYQGPLAQKMELRASVEALAALQARYEALSGDTRAYAEQLAEIERLRKSGLSGEELDRAAQAVQARTSETLRSIEAEKALATASADTAEQMEHQATAAAATAQALASLKGRVGRRIIAAQSPEKRKEVAESELKGILTREKAGTIGEIRDRVNTAATPEEQERALKALDEWLDRQQDLKRANDELATAAKKTADANEAGFEESKSAAEKFRNTLDGIYTEQDRVREQARDQATARASYATSVRALQLELAGRKDLADQLRQEVDLLGQVADFAKTHGVSEAQALRLLRERFGLEERMRKATQSGRDSSPQLEFRRGAIRRLSNGPGDFNVGNNLQTWQWNLGPDAPKVGLRNHEQSRRNMERAVLNPRPPSNGTEPLLRKSLQIQEELLKWTQKIGVV